MTTTTATNLSSDHSVAREVGQEAVDDFLAKLKMELFALTLKDLQLGELSSTIEETLAEYSILQYEGGKLFANGKSGQEAFSLGGNESAFLGLGSPLSTSASQTRRSGRSSHLVLRMLIYYESALNLGLEIFDLSARIIAGTTMTKLGVVLGCDTFPELLSSTELPSINSEVAAFLASISPSYEQLLIDKENFHYDAGELICQSMDIDNAANGKVETEQRADGDGEPFDCGALQAKIGALRELIRDYLAFTGEQISKMI